MTNQKGVGVTLKQLADLHQTTAVSMRAMLDDSSGPKTIAPFERFFDFSDALEIEVARQMNDNSGVPLHEAFRLCVYTTAVKSYLAHKVSDQYLNQDYWLAVTAARNTWGSAPRGSWPITGFGPKEYWSEMHYTGTLGTIMGDITESIGRDQVHYPDSDPARIVMCNVSAADRRLRKRADELGLVDLN